MATRDYYLDFNVRGEERKRLVQAISTFTGADAKYLGTPTFAYEVDSFYIDRKGTVYFYGNEDVEGLVEGLFNQGLVALISNFGYEE